MPPLLMLDLAMIDLCSKSAQYYIFFTSVRLGMSSQSMNKTKTGSRLEKKSFSQSGIASTERGREGPGFYSKNMSIIKCIIYFCMEDLSENLYRGVVRVYVLYLSHFN